MSIYILIKNKNVKSKNIIYNKKMGIKIATRKIGGKYAYELRLDRDLLLALTVGVLIAVGLFYLEKEKKETNKKTYEMYKICGIALLGAGGGVIAIYILLIIMHVW